MLPALLDIAIGPAVSVVEMLEYLVIGLLVAGAIAGAIVLIVIFSKKKKKKE